MTNIQNPININNQKLIHSNILNINFIRFENNAIIETANKIYLVNGDTGKITASINATDQHMTANFAGTSAVQMPYQSLLITSNENDNQECDVLLWDLDSEKCIAILSKNEKNLIGIGTSAGGRYIISTTPFGEIIKTELYDDSCTTLLWWMKNNEPNILQKYLLRSLCIARKLNNPITFDKNSPEYRILESLPATEELNIRELIEKYLLKK